MANYLDFSADVFGVGSDVDALAKQVNENAAGRCTYFDDSSDRISTDFANHSVRKLFKTPISERWGKQICLNE